MQEIAEYPEHEKLKLISDKSNAIGAFLDWVQYQKKITLAERRNNEYGIPMLYPIQYHFVDLLAEYFNIDRDKIEQEKLKMIQECSKK